MRLDSPVVAFPASMLNALMRGERHPALKVRKVRRKSCLAYSALAERRMALGLTQVCVAERLRVDVCAVKRVERRPGGRRLREQSVLLRERMVALYVSLEARRAAS
jgi:hypothetical protein